MAIVESTRFSDLINSNLFLFRRFWTGGSGTQRRFSCATNVGLTRGISCGLATRSHVHGRKSNTVVRAYAQTLHYSTSIAYGCLLLRRRL